MKIRPSVHADAAELAALLNEVVAQTGTSALEEPLDEVTFADWFIDGPLMLTSFLAEHEGRAIGFQTVSRYGDLPEGWGDIGTFTRQPGRGGVGSALFERTRAEAVRLGLVALKATIRADNEAGLAYYASRGFEDYRVDRAVPLKDGRPVDRISKVLRLA